ncbi:hypothetical protein CONPUDRAFT_83252 [Coniophora puteana RWD-64-598 SS2]|uniref:Uncharacterized protein n=1 Tax=Coniophora puteana (strain RWD-64-598) TaxID=741705 RepID=A0A5M3MI57_CONPW|nr:uncharacterized protein CONPUDRAFT_83252 [Coniophora puteana RWD-64-598 SS2]EIW78773.1 hypothetical protein CONPUDRAFT_83252 [Coniophora puteana RWD-64-598 SS2]
MRVSACAERDWMAGQSSRDGVLNHLVDNTLRSTTTRQTCLGKQLRYLPRCIMALDSW